jgi:Zn-dependent peptidase ImmA (M78 family)
MDRIRRSFIENEAAMLTNRFDLKPGFNIKKLLPLLSFELKSSLEFKDISGALFVKDGVKTIVINTAEHENRQRFTIAHEIAHDILNHGLTVSLFKKEVVFYRSTSNPQLIMEFEANYFAACFLMPRDLLLIDLKSKSFISEETIDELAVRYSVSPKAMAIRLSELGFA